MSGTEQTKPRNIPGAVRAGVIVSLILSLFTLLLYGAGEGFNDRTLLLLLEGLRFLSVFLVVCSLCALVCSIWLMIRRPRFRYALGMALYLALGALGAVLTALNSFIGAVAGGNG